MIHIGMLHAWCSSGERERDCEVFVRKSSRAVELTIADGQRADSLSVSQTGAADAVASGMSNQSKSDHSQLPGCPHGLTGSGV